MPDAAPLQPVSARERIQAIDVLRGFALFGIIAANMRGFNSPAQVYMSTEAMWPGRADQVVQALIDFWISGKFITLFAFLFGLGFAVQMERAAARGRRFVAFYCRRMFALLLIGLAHAFLLWWGDILVAYALAGFLPLLFRRRSPQTIRIWIIAGLLFPVLLGILFLSLSALGMHLPGPPKPSPELIQRAVRAYGQGGLGQIMTQRLKDLQWAYIGMPFYLPVILALFLLGFQVWRQGIFQDPAAHLPLIRRALRWGLAIGLAGNLVATVITQIWHPDPIKPSGLGVVRGLAGAIGVPALSCFYASAILLLFQRPAWRRRLLPFAAVGRTALSNYLLQSVVCTTMFYSYGLGLFGKVGPAVGLIPTILIFGAQIPLSVWWLRRFQFGPMEWLWRSLSYGRLQTMRPVPVMAAEA